jgi:predicted nucleic-acid-binding protein
MPSLDTNVLVRWLIEDDREQVERVRGLFESTRADQLMLFVPSTVTLELEWVLRSRHGFDKATVMTAFNALLETQEIEFQDEAALEHSLHLYRLGAAEFADCLHAGLSRAANRAPLLTFDAKAARLESVEMLGA